MTEEHYATWEDLYDERNRRIKEMVEAQGRSIDADWSDVIGTPEWDEMEEWYVYQYWRIGEILEGDQSP